MNAGISMIAPWKTAHPPLLFWALWLFIVMSPLLFHLSLWALTSSLCPYDMAHSSWHVLLVLPDRLEGVKSPWVLFCILSGQQAYFQRSHSLIPLLGASLISIRFAACSPLTCSFHSQCADFTCRIGSCVRAHSLTCILNWSRDWQLKNAIYILLI